MTQNQRHHCREAQPARGLPRTVSVLAAAAVVATACSSGSSAHPSTTAVTGQPTTSVSTPAATPSALPTGVLASVDLDGGFYPAGISAGFGSLWVASHRAAEVDRVNPSTNKVTAVIQADDCCGTPVIGAGHVWAGNEVIDPKTNKVVATLNTNGVFAVVSGYPWAFYDHGIYRMDPTTYKRLQSIPVDANARKVSDPDTEPVYGDGAFWVIVVGDETGTFGGVLLRIDAVSGKLLHTYRPPDPGIGADIQWYDGAIWLKGYDSGRLVKVDAQTGKSTVYRLPGYEALTSLYPQVIALGLGDLWIRISPDKVVRFRPRTGRVVATYPADPDGNGGLSAVAFGSLWVGNFDTYSVWRDRITKV